jgi:hypothetical protein
MSLPNSTKFLKIPFLVSRDEMACLMHALGDFEVLLLGKIVPSPKVTHEVFLNEYHDYVKAIKTGEIPSRLNSFVWTNSGGVALQSFGEKGELARPKMPMLLLQPSHVNYQQETKEFKPISFGQNLISWGFQLSYPTLYQDPISGKIEKVLENEKFGNTPLFKIFQKWIRKNTSPTPFLIEETKVNVPLRLGKECFSWIQHHRQLNERGLRVALHANS